MARARNPGPVFAFALAAMIGVACAGTAFQGAEGGSDEGDTGGAGSEDGTSTGPADSARSNPKSTTNEPLRPPASPASGGTGGSANEDLSTDTASQPPPQGGSANSEPPATAGAPAAGAEAAGAAGAGGSNIVDFSCTTPIVEDWTEALGSNRAWQIAWGDPMVDVNNHRLVLSYDDVAERRDAYRGSYYLEGDVTIGGNVAFTPYPYVNEVLLPTLRRSDAGIQLGATIYGQSQSFELSGWGKASGTVISVATTVHVASFVQAASKAFAIRVTSGNAAHRSAWVTDFHWPETNLGVMRFVGENNSGGTEGGGLIFVEKLRGCQNLDDATIAKLFDE